MIKELEDDAVNHQDDKVHVLEALAHLVLSSGEEVEVRDDGSLELCPPSGVHCGRAGQGRG